MIQPINDHLTNNLKILFVGFNPSIRSGEVGHHYANPTNRFYKILYHAGLTERLYQPNEDYKLLEIGYGFSNIVARPTKAAADITKEEYEIGRAVLRNKITTYSPKVVCFVGKGVYQEYSKRRQIEWGIQEKPIVEDVTEFVAPSSSGLVRMKMANIVAIYEQLTSII